MPIRPRSAIIATALPERGERSGAPLGGHAQTRAREDEPGDAEPGADPECAEQPVMHRSGDCSTTREDEHGRKDHRRRRSLRSRSARGEGRDAAAEGATAMRRATGNARADAATACACAWDGLGRSEPYRELDVERVEDGLPGPLDRARCYQQIDLRKCGGGYRCELGRPNGALANIRAHTTRMCCRGDLLSGLRPR